MGIMSTAERYFLVCKLRKILDIALRGVGCDSSDAIASWRWYWFVGVLDASLLLTTEMVVR